MTEEKKPRSPFTWPDVIVILIVCLTFLGCIGLLKDQL